jgi:hypothetical protein
MWTQTYAGYWPQIDDQPEIRGLDDYLYEPRSSGCLRSLHTSLGLCYVVERLTNAKPQTMGSHSESSRYIKVLDTSPSAIRETILMRQLVLGVYYHLIAIYHQKFQIR